MINRRTFISHTAAGILTLAIPGYAKNLMAKTRSLQLGIITDLHHDIMHDSNSRLTAFADSMKAAKPHGLLQLGDFAIPSEKNREIISHYNKLHSKTFHVIGNHDTDSGFTHQQCVEVWEMPAAYYSSVLNGYRIIVLNGNEKGSPAHTGGYPAYIGPVQQQWLHDELTASKEPVIICCHQPLIGYAAVDNTNEIQQLLQQKNEKIIIVLNGHTHIDRVDYIGEIPCVTINSASYYWMGDKFKHQSYAAEIHEQHPWIAYTCPYRDALFTLLTIDPASNTISIAARNSEWVGKSPAELGYYAEQTPLSENDVVPKISKRDFSITGHLKK